MNHKPMKMIADTLRTAYHLDRQAVVLTALSALLRAATPYVAIFLSAYVVDALTRGAAFYEVMRVAALGVAATFLLSALLDWLDKRAEVRVEVCVRRFNMLMGEKTLAMDYELVDSPLVGEIRARIRIDRNWGAGFYSVFWWLNPVLTNLFGVIAAIATLFPLFKTTALFSGTATPLFWLGWLLLVAGSSAFQNLYAQRKENALLDESPKLMGIFGHFVWDGYHDYRDGKDVRLYRADRLIKRYIEREVPDLCTWREKVSRVQGKTGLVLGITRGLSQGGAYLYVALSALSGALSVGMVLRFAMAIHNLGVAVMELVRHSGMLSATARRQQSTLDYLNVPDVLHKGTLPIEKRDDYEYALEFKDVSFKYPGNDAWALRHLNLRLNVGQRLAVVGMNGSGKTTMIKLLCRLYDPTEGVITLNGIDIRKYDADEYRRIFAVVFQDFKLFALPLDQNVAAAEDADAAAVSAALHMGGFGERLQGMPRGLDTPLYRDFEEDGVMISGGEAQKIALARALYKDAPFVILDEPTAALDPIAEADVYARMNDIVSGRSAVFISHRLSSCRFCHDIAVFHEGSLIQRGSHDELLAQANGKYAQLWNAQAQYYADNGG